MKFTAFHAWITVYLRSTHDGRTEGGTNMHNQKRSRRVRAAIVGTLLASVMSVGAVTETASAAKPDASVSVDDNSLQIKLDFSTMSMRSGIRW